MQKRNAHELLATNLQSRVNNGGYYGDLLPPQNWDWPEETWFQKRLLYLRRGKDKAAEELTDQDLQ